jgi:solute carrier family 35 protein E1
VLLGLTSPVTYSVASLMKRVAVIIFAIVWFGNPMTYIQGAGFALTFLGLYLYDRTSENEKADKRARAMGESKQPLLPLNVGDDKKNDPAPPMYTQSPVVAEDAVRMFGGASGYANGDFGGHSQGRARSGSRPSPGQNGMPYSLPLGTKAEETWRETDVGTPPLGIGVR